MDVFPAGAHDMMNKNTLARFDKSIIVDEVRCDGDDIVITGHVNHVNTDSWSIPRDLVNIKNLRESYEDRLNFIDHDYDGKQSDHPELRDLYDGMKSAEYRFDVFDDTSVKSSQVSASHLEREIDMVGKSMDEVKKIRDHATLLSSMYGSDSFDDIDGVLGFGSHDGNGDDGNSYKVLGTNGEKVLYAERYDDKYGDPMMDFKLADIRNGKAKPSEHDTRLSYVSLNDDGRSSDSPNIKSYDFDLKNGNVSISTVMDCMRVSNWW